MSEALAYFNGNELAANVWESKYALKNEKGELVERTPDDMHRRMAKEFARIENNYQKEILINTYGQHLSEFGKKLFRDPLTEDKIFNLFKNFKYIVPQGSIMAMLGNPYKIGVLSNCFVIPPPFDSYGGILKTDEQLVQLMKRRGGVGTHLSTLRLNNSPVSNAAGSSTGVVSFASRYSNSTREVAQNGRRGALMLLLHCSHPEIFDYTKSKKDRTKITGANISVMLTDKFMHAVLNDKDFMCCFPINAAQFINPNLEDIEYNKLISLNTHIGDVQIMKIHAKELFDLIVEMAWDNAEPGVAFIDRILKYCPEGVYPKFAPIAANPCGEQWLEAYNSCRLLALNLFSIVRNPFKKDSYLDYDKLYEIAYLQQRLADDVVDLDVEYVDKIIHKIYFDKEPFEVRRTELELWERVRDAATNSRRTGSGITGLGDMLAALGIKYDSDEGISVLEEVMKIKMKAELDCTIDMAIQRGTFVGWDTTKEFYTDEVVGFGGCNIFFENLTILFPKEARKMAKFGRRNINWNNVSPTGTVSLLTETSSGLEPLFLPYYMRRKKVNAGEKGVKIDFIDQNGDSWMEFAVLHPKFKDWCHAHNLYPDGMTKDQLDETFKLSPWFGACANDIDWIKRVEIQSIIQKYTTNAISSTINLPENVSKSVISDIYLAAWQKGLKGVTVYRDNCRSGVLVSTDKKEEPKLAYKDAVKRPKSLNADLHITTVKGVKYGVLVGLLENKPYEVFAFVAPESITKCSGKIVKVKKGQYDFISEAGVMHNMQEAAVHADEQVLSRLVSGMLRHRINPQFVIEQIDKTPLEVVSYGKALTRVLKKYISEEQILERVKCPECGSKDFVFEEGCKSCKSCGYSAC